MSLLLYGGAAVLVAGVGLGALAYYRTDDAGDEPDTDADADTQAPDADDTDADYSTAGRAIAAAASAVPDPERGVRETVVELTDRRETQYSSVGAVLATVVSAIPKPLLGVRGTLFKRMALKSIENYHKTAGGDAIAINAKDGQQIDLEPVKFKPPETCEEGDRPGWHVKGRDKVWNPAKEGNSVNYLGRTPVATFQDDAHVEAGWLAPRVGQAIEMDQYWALFTDPTIVAHLHTNNPAATNGAVADGGASQFELSLDDFGQYADDAIVDLGSGPGYDGMRISMSKAREWQAETVASEEMQLQDDRAFIRGLRNAEDGPSAFKLLLLAGGIILGVLLIIFVLPELLGGGGISAGGINPLLLGGLL
jgi:hypothetical protein